MCGACRWEWDAQVMDRAVDMCVPQTCMHARMHLAVGGCCVHGLKPPHAVSTGTTAACVACWRSEAAMKRAMRATGGWPRLIDARDLNTSVLKQLL